MSIEEMTPENFRDLRRDGFAGTVLDVREPHERACCAIGPDDLHVPMGEVPDRLAEIARAPGPIVVYCHHGVRSMMVARWLETRGVAKVWNLEGGIDAWSLRVDCSVPRYR